MGIPLKGVTDTLIESFGNWSEKVCKDAEVELPQVEEIVVASGTLFCPKYQTKVLASECAICGECISSVAHNDRLNRYVVKCGYELKQAEQQNNSVETIVEAQEESVDLGEYNWEEEKINEIEKVVATKIEKQDWERVQASQKLSTPDTMRVQFLGSSSVVKIPSSYTDALGDRNKIADNQMSVFESKEALEDKVQSVEADKKILQDEVQEKAAQAEERRHSWEKEYLTELNNILEQNKDLSSIKKIANEGYQTQNREAPTGKIGIFDNSLKVDEDNTHIQNTAKLRATKKENEWETQQEAAVQEQVAQKDNIKEQSVFKIGEDAEVRDGFKHSKDQTSIFNTDSLEELGAEKSIEEKLEESRKIQRKDLGVREAQEDKSWDDYEHQKAESMQNKAMQSPIMQEFFGKIAKTSSDEMEKFLVEASKTNSSRGDATENEGGFRRLS